MLILSRKLSEAILIGEGPDQVRVIISEVRGSIIRIGIDAPKHIKVMREELVEKKP